MNACFLIYCLKVKGNVILENGPTKQWTHEKKQKNTHLFLRERQRFPPQSLRGKECKHEKRQDSHPKCLKQWMRFVYLGEDQLLQEHPANEKVRRYDSFGSNGCWCLNLHQDVGNKKGTDFSDQSVWNEKSQMPRLFLLSQLESWRQEFYILPVILPSACRSSCFKNSMATRRFECCLAGLFDMGCGIKYVFMVNM